MVWNRRLVKRIEDSNFDTTCGRLLKYRGKRMRRDVSGMKWVDIRSNDDPGGEEGSPPDFAAPIAALGLFLKHSGQSAQRILLPSFISAQGALQQAPGHSFHVGKEFRIGCRPRDDERNVVGLHF